jgi:hypothetical protein
MKFSDRSSKEEEVAEVKGDTGVGAIVVEVKLFIIIIQVTLPFLLIALIVESEAG